MDFFEVCWSKNKIFFTGSSKPDWALVNPVSLRLLCWRLLPWMRPQVEGRPHGGGDLILIIMVDASWIFVTFIFTIYSINAQMI